METSADCSFLPQHISIASIHSGATISIDERIQQITSILKPLYYAEASEFDTAETHALTKRLVALSKLRDLQDDEQRIRCGEAFCSADIPAVFHRVWSVSNYLKPSQAYGNVSCEAIGNNSLTKYSVLTDDERPFSLVYKDLVTCLWNLTDVNTRISKLIFEHGCLRIFIDDLRSQHFLDKRMNDGIASVLGYVIRGYFGILRNAVHADPNCLSQFLELGGVEASVPYLDTSFYYLKTKVIMLLAAVVTDERDETWLDIVGSHDNLEYVVTVLADALISGTEEDGFYSRKFGYGAAELLDAIAKLATSNDRNVHTFLETDLLDTLEQLFTRLHAALLSYAPALTNRAPTSVACALRSQVDTAAKPALGIEDNKVLAACCNVLHAAFSCFWALAFSEAAKEAILRRRTFVDILRACTPQPAGCAVQTHSVASISHLLSTKMHYEAAGALWQLQRCSSTGCSRMAHCSEEEMANSNDGHLMVTYQHSSQELVRPLYEALTGMGLRVWIDYAEMYGSTVESMALAVERSHALLVCVSNAYKQSPSCRAEAMYAYRLKKPFIPLRVQVGYTPDGWLGFICGTEMVLELSKPAHFHGTLQRLMRILWQRGFSQGLPLPAEVNDANASATTHAHKSAKPGTNFGSHITPHVGSTSSKEAPLVTPPSASQFNSSSASQHRMSNTQHQYSAPPSHGAHSRDVARHVPLAAPAKHKPAQIDHVFIPTDMSDVMNSVESRSTTRHGLSNAVSNYSLAQTSAGTQNGNKQLMSMLSTSSTSLSINAPTDYANYGSAKESIIDKDDKLPDDRSRHNSGECTKVTADGSEFKISNQLSVQQYNPSRRNSAYPNIDFCELVTWTNEDVTRWLLEQGVDEEACTRLRGIDGGLLFELTMMQKEAPQFLYSALSSDYQLSLVSLLRFLRALHKLNSPQNQLNHYSG